MKHAGRLDLAQRIHSMAAPNGPHRAVWRYVLAFPSKVTSEWMHKHNAYSRHLADLMYICTILDHLVDRRHITLRTCRISFQIYVGD